MAFTSPKNSVRTSSAKLIINRPQTGKSATANSCRNFPKNFGEENRSDGSKTSKESKCGSNSGREESVRDLLVAVPCPYPKIYPKIWRSDELRRVKTASRVITKEEKQRQLERCETEKVRLQWECERRKKLLRDIDKERAKSAKKPSFSDDDEDSPAKVIDRAFLAKQEQTEEIKKVNRLILATKCHVVRDAQITEKQEIQRQLREDELQLEKKMLEECDKALKEEEMHRDEQKKLNEKHAEDLRTQLKRREMNKFLEAQRIEDEAKAIARTQQAINEEARKKENEKLEKNQRIRRDLQQANELSDFFKSLAFEEQRIAEMKAQEHMRMRKERDTEFFKERRLLQEMKQREADRFLVAQTKYLKAKSQREEMKLRLINEEKDRQFRQREKEAAIKKKAMEQKLMTAREAQLSEMKRVRAVQVAQEEEEHKRVMDKLKAEEEKERRENERHYLNKEKYRKEIINQIDEKVSKQKEMKALAMNEKTVEQQKEEIRKKNIEKIVAAKVNAMRQANIPEKFVKDVERQINFDESIKFVK